jgi:hypothetical protein
MATPFSSKEQQLREYLANDHTWTAFEELDAVSMGWIFLPHPDGGFAAWRKPPRWVLSQPPGDPIRPRVRGGTYKASDRT